jgi:predicted CoA-binding protein
MERNNAMPRVAREMIDAFFATEAFAVVGVSANQHKFGNIVYRTMKEKEAVVYPVHPTLSTVEGDACYPTVATLPDAVHSVIIVVPPAVTAAVVGECAKKGITHVWMQPGAESNEAIAAAESAGIAVIHHECILMFLEPVKSVHAFHRFINKVVGKYPK